jgi:hypothetical protein
MLEPERQVGVQLDKEEEVEQEEGTKKMMWIMIPIYNMSCTGTRADLGCRE